jgi:transcriptional regulator with XRE-family HTH domain
MADAALKARFGANVKTFRHRLGFSQEKLAERADMHRTYLADIERGGRNISLFSIVRLVNALGITLAQFFRKLDNGFEPPPLQRMRRRSTPLRAAEPGAKKSSRLRR